MTESNFSHRKESGDNRIWTTVAVAIIALIIGFAGGYYSKAGVKGTTTAQAGAGNTSSGSAGTGGGFRGGARRMSDFGTVTAVSSTSITINNTQSGQSQTFSITSATTVTDSGSSSSVSNIAVGDTVAIIPSTTDTTQATRILLNPSFGNFQPQSSSGGSSSSGNGT